MSEERQEPWGRRVDYIKCYRELDVDLAFDKAQLWLDLFDEKRQDSSKAHTAHVVSVKRGNDGKYWYAFEAWGPSANKAQYLDFDEWAKFCTRVDLREEVDSTEEGCKNILAHMEQENPTRRNVNWLSSRPRAKRGGRNAGGKGVQIGSHHSEFYISIYRRSGEMGAIEFQIEGQRLARALDVVRMFRGSETWQFKDNPWNGFFYWLRLNAQMELETITGFNIYELRDIAEGHAIPHTIVENRLERMEREFKALEPPAQEAFLYMAQQRLWEVNQENPPE